MVAAIRRVPIKPGHMQEVTRRVQEGLVPLISKVPGFISYHAIDAGNNVAISVTLFRDRAASEAAVKAGTPWVEANIATLIGPIEVAIGEVIVSAAAVPV